MKKEINLSVRGERPLSEKEMKIKGGGFIYDKLVSPLVTAAIQIGVKGLQYFYHMGRDEANSYKKTI